MIYTEQSLMCDRCQVEFGTARTAPEIRRLARRQGWTYKYKERVMPDDYWVTHDLCPSCTTATENEIRTRLSRPA